MVSGKPRLTPEGRPRFFKSCDAARIAKNVVLDQKERPEEVLACIAKALGFTHISLSREQKTVEAGVNLSKGTVTTIVRTAKSFLNFLKRRFPDFAARIGAIIEILDKVERALDVLLDQPEQERVEDVLPPGKCNCNFEPLKLERGPEDGS